MKISCTKDNLQTGLTAVSHIASKNLTLPILGNVLLKTEQGGLSLRATNLEVGIVARVRGKVAEEGSVSIQARLLSEYINLLEHEKVDLLSDGPNLRVKGATSETTMRGMPPEDFPIIPAVSKEQTISVPSQEFRDALVQVLFAAAQDTSRPEISGMFLSATPTSLTLAATDSYRLAERALGINAGFVRTAIIPTRPLHEIVRIVSGEGSVEIALSDTQALFTLEGTEVTSRLIEGRYPDYRQIIPTTARTSATVQVEQLVKLIRTASLFCKPGINDVTIELSPKSGTITCSAANAELGEHRGSLKADVTGSENTVVFNYRYFLDGLANIATASAMIQVTDSAGPGVVRPTDGKEYLYLIMPIRQ